MDSDIFDLENDLPDEIMASTSQPAASITRNNFRVIPATDGSNKLRIRVEPISSTSRPARNDQPLPATSSIQTVADSASGFFPPSAMNLSIPQNTCNQTATTSLSTYLPQSHNMPGVNPPMSSLASSTPWYSPRPPNNQSVYPTTSSQPVDMSSSFLSQSQTNQYIHPSMSSQSAGVSSSPFLYQSSNNQTVYPSTSSQSMGMSSKHQTNPSRYFFPPISPTASFQPSSMNPSITSRFSNQAAYEFPSYPIPSTPRYIPTTTTYAPTAPRYIPTTSSTQNRLLYSPAPGASSNQPRPTDRKDEMRRRLAIVYALTSPRDSQPDSVAQVQPTTSSALSQPVSQNVQAIVAGLKSVESNVTKTTPVIETPFGQQSQNRENQNAMNLVQSIPSTANNASSSSDKNLTANTQQNITKEWQREINSELRKHLVEKLVVTMFPTTTPSALMQSLKSYIEKTEREIYEAANSKNEYYILLAEKNYKIQKEINKKRLEKKEQQLQQQQQQQQLQQTLRSQRPNNDIEMATVQPSDEAARPLDSNSNIAENQSTNTTSGASHILSLVHNVSTQKNFTKEWHKQIGAELREILVKEFVQKMLPVSGSEAVINNSEEASSTINDRIKTYAKNVECDIYQKADSRIEYYDLLADKYCKMQDELRKGNFAALDNS